VFEFHPAAILPRRRATLSTVSRAAFSLSPSVGFFTDRHRTDGRLSARAGDAARVLSTVMAIDTGPLRSRAAQAVRPGAGAATSAPVRDQPVSPAAGIPTAGPPTAGPPTAGPPTARPAASTTTRSLPQAQAAARELRAHAAALGVVSNEGVSPGPAIVAAELARGAQKDPRVDDAAMQRAVDRAARAATLSPVRQNVLFGFTRVVDAKLSLSPAVLGALADDVGAADADRLLQAIDKGPGDSALVWPRPQTRVELVASLVRQLVKGGGASLQVSITPELSHWLEDVVAREGTTVNRAMGGAGAFCANLACAFSPLRPRFFSGEPLPRGIADRFAQRVEVVDKTGSSSSPRARATDEPARVNYSAEYTGGQGLVVLGRDTLTIDGKPTMLATSGSGRVILGTKARDITPGFDGVDHASLQKLARDNDVFFFVGSHYLTQGAPADAHAAAARLADDLDVMKAENPALVRHLQYVVPKVAAHEATVLSALAGHVESMSLNAVEVPALVHRLHAAGLTGTPADPGTPRDIAEQPSTMLSGALGLAQAMKLSRVHLHGAEGDLVVVDGPVDVDRTRAALLKARQVAAMKATNDSGEIKGPEDLFDVVPVVLGTGLAAVEAFADDVARRFSLSPAERDRVARDWCFADKDGGRTIFFVPSRGIHDRTGGTVSLGDTIDATALLFARTAGRPPVHPQLAR
jgi:ADP-dependent phosphofructokinase/glucokinase